MSDIEKLLVERIFDFFEVWGIPSLPKDPFKILVATIISQNTSDRNAIEAFNRLEASIGVNPFKIADADLSSIMEAIKPAGLYSRKAKTIKRVAEIIVKEYGGSLQKILEMPLEKARKTLLKIPGIGYKTADVLLLFCGNKPVIPIDTHIRRVSIRLGLVDEKADYETIRRRLEEIFPRDKFFEAHVSMIMFGRKICKATKPLCDKCPFKEECTSYRRKKLCRSDG